MDVSRLEESRTVGRCKRRCLPVPAANSFQAREGATGVIGHNLVDSLIYKQSLMKFLVFINNALQPRAALPPLSASVPGNPVPSSHLLLLALPRLPPFSLRRPPTPFIVPLSSNPYSLFRGNFGTFPSTRRDLNCRLPVPGALPSPGPNFSYSRRSGYPILLFTVFSSSF